MTENELKETGERLIAIRKNLGFRQNEFAGKLGISNANLSEIEAGNAKPRYELIYNITKKFNVNAYYLIHGEGDMFMPVNIPRVLGVEDIAPYSDWLREFLRYFTKSEIVRYHIMAYFRGYLLENKNLIDRDINDGENEKKQ